MTNENIKEPVLKRTCWGWIRSRIGWVWDFFLLESYFLFVLSNEKPDFAVNGTGYTSRIKLVAFDNRAPVISPDHDCDH